MSEKSTPTTRTAVVRASGEIMVSPFLVATSSVYARLGAARASAAAPHTPLRARRGRASREASGVDVLGAGRRAGPRRRARAGSAVDRRADRARRRGRGGALGGAPRGRERDDQE